MPQPSQYGVNALLQSANAGDLYTAILQGLTIARDWAWFAARFVGYSAQVVGRALGIYRRAVEAGTLTTTSGLDYTLDPGQIPRNPAVSQGYEYRVTIDSQNIDLLGGEPLTVIYPSDEILTYGQLGGGGGRMLAKLLRESGFGSDIIALAWESSVTVSVDYVFRS